MSWRGRVLGQTWPGDDIADAVEALLAQQREVWQLLVDNETALRNALTRHLQDGVGQVVVQCNPERIRSSGAKVDAASIASRPCFLCEPNLPREERTLAFGHSFVIAPNPFPIVPGHLSVITRQHVPQELAGRVYCLVELARALGPGWLALYNGPRCGASAPDHFHLQAGRASGLPLLDELASLDSTRTVTPLRSFGRNAIVFRGDDEPSVVPLIERALTALNVIVGGAEEPMVNLVAFNQDGIDTVVLFPRARHRPECFFAKGEGRLLISPGALDMAGLLVVAEPAHFDRVHLDLVRQIYAEVSLDDERFERLFEELE